VFVEREPPHLVTVARLTAADLAYAEQRCALACQIFRDCADADVWPGYPSGVVDITLPGWSRRDHELMEEEALW
jgi:hypothetical protein